MIAAAGPGVTARPGGGLSFDQAPAISVPFRFFLTAPAFLLLAALLLAFAADDILRSRWSPAALGVTHLLTLGFLAHIMAGALFQLLPVVGGARVPHAAAVAMFVHIALGAGTVMLASGFLLQSGFLLRAAAMLLGSGWAIFLAAAAIAAACSPARTPTVGAIRFALAALLATTLLGLALLAAPAGRLDLNLLRIVDLHAGWGFIGWIGLLVAGIAYQVVPMFQLTPSYPRRLKSWLGPAIFALLCLWTFAGSPRLRALASIGIACLLLGFAAATLYLQARKRRRVADVTVSFWRLGMTSLAAAAILWIAASIYPELARAPMFPALVAILFLLGFATSVVNGMLYKIAPFLVWFHLSSRQGARGVPLMNAIVPERRARRHFHLHLAAVALALMAAIADSAALMAIAALPLAGGALTLVLAMLGAYRIYLRHTSMSCVQRE